METQVNNNFIFNLLPVEYVDDDCKGLRIKVRIPPYDNDKDITKEPSPGNGDGIPWCFPLLPKIMNINPKVGELVVVFCQQPGAPNSQRMFIGPVISQDYMFDYDYDYNIDTNVDNKKLPKGEVGFSLKPVSSARRLLTASSADRTFAPYPNPDKDGENEGTIPQRESVALRGRGNSDIVLTDDETRIRCGFKVNPKSSIKERLHFNSKDLSYILMRYRNGKDEVGEYKSSVNIVGDRINLISHDSNLSFNCGDRKDLITDEELTNILNKAHELPYGDVLVGFLKAFVDVFRRHTHPYNGLQPILNSADEQTISPNWENMLSQSIRIN